MPRLIDFYEDHEKHRDQFEIIAFHDGTVKDFAELDPKIEPIRKSVWGGRNLPFPVLLDSSGETIKTFEIRAFPTTILIDPNGKLVGEADDSLLEAKLPKLPPAIRVARALDRGVTASIDGLNVVGAATMFSRMARVPISVDEEALKLKGIDPKADVPLTITGRLSLRSFLNLVLRPDGLTVKPEGDGLRITVGAIGELSPAQRLCHEHIERYVLDQPLDFDLKDKSLAEIAKFFEAKTRENFVLDPAARRAGRLDPKLKVSGSSKGAPLRDGLAQLLAPANLTFVVRDEVIVILPKEPK